MNVRRLIALASTLALLAATGLLLLQRLETRRLEAEIADLRSQLSQMTSLQDSSRVVTPTSQASML